MTLIGFLLLLLIAAVAGLIGQALAGYSLGGCIVSIVLGFVGAYIGLWIARAAGLPTFFTVDVGGEAFPVVWAIIGATLLTLAIGLVSRRRLI
jgi:uncharacterized membrane protein YeaQ/YmgE (transglycosylase-associated protein family)